MFVPLRDGFKKWKLMKFHVMFFWPDLVVFLICSVELFPFQFVILSFRAAILQLEKAFVKHFFQLFSVTRDIPLCVSEKKIHQIWKISILSGNFSDLMVKNQIKLDSLWEWS